jgi:hypothetical protein
MWCEQPQVSSINWAAEAMSNADTVFVGKVFSVQKVPRQKPVIPDTDGLGSMEKLLEKIKAGQADGAIVFDHIVSFDVLRYWKTPINPIVRTKVLLGTMSKHRLFEVGDIYLVVGRELDGDLYRIKSRCIDAIHNRFAEKFETALNELVSVP